MDDRRRFMAAVGAVFGSAVTLGCSPLRRLVTGCYIPLPPTKTPAFTCYTVVLTPESRTATPTPVVTCYEAAPATATPGRIQWSQPWQDLARPWYSLDALARVAGNDQEGPEMRDKLIAEHQQALQALVAAGEIDAEVAADLQAAFEGAAYHVWRANSNMTCYMPAPPPDYDYQSRSGLAEQAKVLAEMAERSAIDEATVAKAEANIERDIAFLAMSSEDRQALLEAVRQAAAASGEYPELSEVDMEIPPSAVTAANILVQLLSSPVQSQ